MRGLWPTGISVRIANCAFGLRPTGAKTGALNRGEWGWDGSG